MIKKEHTIRYTITCDFCGEKVIKNKKNSQKGIGIDFEENDENKYYEQLKETFSQAKHYYGGGSEKVSLPSGWIQRGNGKIVCSEDCLVKIIKNDADETVKKELESYRKKVLKNLKK